VRDAMTFAIIAPGIGVRQDLQEGLIHRGGAVEGEVVGGAAVRIVGAGNKVPGVVVPALVLDLDRPAGLAVHGRAVADHLLAGDVEVIEERCPGRDGAQARRGAGLSRERQRQRRRGGNGGQGELRLARERDEESPVRGQRSSPASTASTRPAGFLVLAWLTGSFGAGPKAQVGPECCTRSPGASRPGRLSRPRRTRSSPW
jgi:hypothetical protein